MLAQRGQHRLMHINHGSDVGSEQQQRTARSGVDSGSSCAPAVGGGGCMQHVARLQVARRRGPWTGHEQQDVDGGVNCAAPINGVCVSSHMSVSVCVCECELFLLLFNCDRGVRAR